MFVERFMDWSHGASVEERVEAIARLARKYVEPETPSKIRCEATQIFTLYLDDPSIEVRSSMACVLAPSDRTPKPLIWSLVQDVPEVAAEIFAVSPLLRSTDIVHAVRSGAPLVQQAIAAREDLDGDIVRAIVAHGHEHAVLELLDNELVVLGPGLKHDIAVRLGEAATVRGKLLEGDDIAAATRQMLVCKLTNSLLSLTEDRKWGGPAQMESAISDACNRATVDIANHAGGNSMGDYVVHLCDTGQLTPALLIRAICAGNAALFENAIAILSQTSLKRVQSIVDEGRVSAFSSLYQRTSLPKSAYSVFAAAISVWQNTDDDVSVIMEIISRVENDPSVDGEIMALLGRMAAEENREQAKNYERQLLLAA